MLDIRHVCCYNPHRVHQDLPKQDLQYQAATDMNATAQTLGGFSLFEELDDGALQEILSYVSEQTLEPGQEVALANEPCQAVYLVVRGVIRARRLSLEGREYVLEYIRAGEPFGIASALDGETNLTTGEALARTTVYVIRCEHFRRIVAEHPSVARASLAHLAGQVRHLSNTVEDLALHTVRARLARFLLSREANGAHPARHWTQEEIAIHVGTVRDVVGRTLRSFAREGLIRRERGRLVVTDRAGLQHEAMYV
jgi:CRP/FNR family transcriptional regulator